MTKKMRNTLTGVGFILPNIIGFMVFGLIPILISVYMAFTDWDLTKHNMFREGYSITFIWLKNFIRLWGDDSFRQAFGNTLFFMMGIPLNISGSLFLAVLLNGKTKGRFAATIKHLTVVVLVAAALVLGSLFLTNASATTMLFTSIAFLIIIAGVRLGQVVYRTLFYVPHFTAGVATFILWKKIYNPENGPLNLGLNGPLNFFQSIVQSTPSVIYSIIGFLLVGLMIFMYAWFLIRSRNTYKDGEVGLAGTVIATVFISVPVLVSFFWMKRFGMSYVIAGTAVISLALYVSMILRGQEFKSGIGKNAGSHILFSIFSMVAIFILMGLHKVFFIIYDYGIDYQVALQAGTVMDLKGFEPPNWLQSFHWAKPALMIMGFWGAIGSNNMLLYLAGLSNIPPDLYEAADIDGASEMQKFVNVTWPQLAPTTFFIFVMGIIYGLQGGFEAARTMTQGGPAGATTTLSYYLFELGFEQGNLGYAASVAWTLFVIIFIITAINWRYGRSNEVE